MTCDTCGYDIQIGDYPFCKGTPASHQNARFGVIGDDIPGGYEVKHGVCWPDGTPRKFYAKSEIRKAADAAGYTISGETPKRNQQHMDRLAQRKEQKEKQARRG